MDVNIKSNYNTKLRIAKEFWDNEELKKELKIVIGRVYEEIDFINYMLCDTSRFRKIVHTIVDYEFKGIDNSELHKQISENNFTMPILLGIVEVVNEEE